MDKTKDCQDELLKIAGEFVVKMQDVKKNSPHLLALKPFLCCDFLQVLCVLAPCSTSRRLQSGSVCRVILSFPQAWISSSCLLPPLPTSHVHLRVHCYPRYDC